MSAWNHGADPSDYLLINDRVQLFKVRQHDQLRLSLIKSDCSCLCIVHAERLSSSMSFYLTMA